VGGALLVFLVAVASCTVDLTTPDRPDVLLVVLDTVRADRLSAYGHERLTDIYLSSLAEGSGVLFEDVTAPGSWTWPSHASLFTGEPPWIHGAHLALLKSGGEKFRHDGVDATRMRQDLPTLAERFSEAGYRTVSLGVNGWLAPELGLVRGFQEARAPEDDFAAVAAAEELLQEEGRKPLFLFLNLMAAHGPYNATRAPWVEKHRKLLHAETAPDWLRPYLYDGEPPGVHLAQRLEGHLISGVDRYLLGKLEIPPEGIELLLDLYDGEVALADRLFGTVFTQWARSRPDSVVVVTSDHGELFGEHGLMEHRGSVYPELVSVPLVIAAPGRLQAGVRIRTPVQLQDLYPTLLELAGIDSLPGSLVPVIHGEPRPGPIVAAAWPDDFRANVIGGQLRYGWNLYRLGDEALIWGSGGDLELYDLAADPRMTADLSVEQPDRAEALREEAEATFGDVLAIQTEPLALSEKAIERLREIGYLVD
jgi:arylsulfatase A-like enzyme